MKHVACRLLVLALGAGLLAACASHPVAGVAVVQRKPPPASGTAHPVRSSEAVPSRPHRTHHRPSPPAPAPTADAVASSPSQQDTVPALERTDIPSCDDYLASYVACHRAAGIYPPQDIEAHYRQMRQTLLRLSTDSDVRPQLAERCNWLAGQLRQALHGRSCNGGPASTGSSPAH